MKKNRGLIDKKAYEDQLVPFFSLVLDLSHYSLSLSPSHSWALRDFLEHFGIASKKAKKARGRKEKA